MYICIHVCTYVNMYIYGCIYVCDHALVFLSHTISCTNHSILFKYLPTCSAKSLQDLGASNRLLVIKYLDALTIAVPPSLLTCLIVATAIAIRRLNEKKIHVSETHQTNNITGPI